MPRLGVNPKTERCQATMRLDNERRDSHGGKGRERTRCVSVSREDGGCSGSNRLTFLSRAMHKVSNRLVMGDVAYGKGK